MASLTPVVVGLDQLADSESLDKIYNLFLEHPIFFPLVIAVVFWLHYYIIYTIFGAIRSLLGFAFRVVKTVFVLYMIFAVVYWVKNYALTLHDEL